MKNIKSFLVRGFQCILLPAMVYILFLIISKDRFGSWDILLITMRQSVIPILLALGILCNMTMNMWDFSVGAVIYCSAIIGGNLAYSYNLGVFGMIALCVIVATLLTSFTGFLYTKVKLPSLVLTIGVCMIYEAISQAVFNGKVYVPLSYSFVTREPYVFIILILGIALMYFIFNKTSFGFNVRMIGNNQAVAAASGINIRMIKFISFVLGGIYLGVYASLMLTTNSVLTAPAAMGSMNIIFDAMMGVFIGMFLSRYCNVVFGVAIGAFTMKLLGAGLASTGLNASVRDMITGLFMLVLLCVSANQDVVAQYKKRKHDAEMANREYQKKFAEKVI